MRAACKVMLAAAFADLPDPPCSATEMKWDWDFWRGSVEKKRSLHSGTKPPKK